MPSAGPWVVVVVRAWLEPGGPRIRLLREDSTGERSEEVTTTPRHAADLIQQWIDQLGRQPG